MANANSTSSRTSKRNAGPVKAGGPSTHLIDQIRQQAQEIETRACDIEILLETIFEKIDRLASAGPVKTLDAINTLTTCALRNVALIKKHHEHISELIIAKGGAQ